MTFTTRGLDKSFSNPPFTVAMVFLSKVPLMTLSGSTRSKEESRNKRLGLGFGTYRTTYGLLGCKH